jgi:hypothetical protein
MLSGEKMKICETRKFFLTLSFGRKKIPCWNVAVFEGKKSRGFYERTKSKIKGIP